MGFRIFRDQLHQRACEAKRFFDERGAGPLFTGGRGVTLVKDEVDYEQDGLDAFVKFFPARRFERHVRVAEGFLRPGDALAHRLFRYEKCSGRSQLW